MFLCEFVEQTLACFCAQFCILIRAAGPVRPGKGDMVVADGIAANQQRFTALAQFKGHMARRVAKTCLRHDAGQNFLTVFDLFHLVLDCPEPSCGTHSKSRAGFADTVHRRGITPIVPFIRAHKVSRIWENRIVKVIQHAPKVVRVRMGKDNMGHLFGCNACGIEAVEQQPRTGHEAGA